LKGRKVREKIFIERVGRRTKAHRPLGGKMRGTLGGSKRLEWRFRREVIQQKHLWVWKRGRMVMGEKVALANEGENESNEGPRKRARERGSPQKRGKT